jgi:hypothetical protein
MLTIIIYYPQQEGNKDERKATHDADCDQSSDSWETCRVSWNNLKASRRNQRYTEYDAPPKIISEIAVDPCKGEELSRRH